LSLSAEDQATAEAAYTENLEKYGIGDFKYVGGQRERERHAHSYTNRLIDPSNEGVATSKLLVTLTMPIPTGVQKLDQHVHLTYAARD